MQFRLLNASEPSELDNNANDGLALLGAEHSTPDLLDRLDRLVVSMQGMSKSNFSGWERLALLFGM